MFKAKSFIESIQSRTDGMPSFVISLKPEKGPETLGPDDDLFVDDGKARYPMIGMLNLGGAPRMSFTNRAVRFGINFVEEHQGRFLFFSSYVFVALLTLCAGKGFGTEVLRWAMDFLFNSLALHRCELMVSAGNSRAIHCYEKVGFVREGVSRSAYWDNGKWMDV